MIPQPGQTLEDRLSELEAAGKLLTHTKTVTVNITILNKRILGLDSAINNFKLQFRDETNYPYLKGRIIPTLV